MDCETSLSARKLCSILLNETDTCVKCFQKKAALVHHLIREHNIFKSSCMCENKPFPCNNCATTTNTTTSMENVAEIILGKKNITCLSPKIQHEFQHRNNKIQCGATIRCRTKQQKFGHNKSIKCVFLYFMR